MSEKRGGYLVAEVKENYFQKISLANKTDEQAADINALFEKNINIAYKVASKYYKTQYWDYDEALQIAQLGLWKACLIWEPNRYRISTLAYNIINRDFSDFDKQQKKQPDILFNLEDNCVTDDLSLNDVLVDEFSFTDAPMEEKDSVDELNEDIIYILEDISEELEIQKSIVKMVYLIFIEASRDNLMSMKDISFISKAKMKQIILRLQDKLTEIRC